jgi:hypothetical protein
MEDTMHYRATEYCLLNRVLERKIEGKGRRRRRHKQLLDDPTEARRSWKLQDGTLDHTPSRNCLWKRQCTYRATEYVMMTIMMMMM